MPRVGAARRDCVMLAIALWGGCARIGDQGPATGTPDAGPVVSPGSGGVPGAGGNGTGSGGAAATGGGGSGGARGGVVTSDGGLPGDGAPSADGPNCGLVKFTLERVPPDVLIVLDKSGSMRDLAKGLLGCIFGQCNSKWTDMKEALRSTVIATEATIDWGVKLFPTDDACGVADQVAAPVAPRNAAAVNAAIAAQTPSGLTPTRFAIEGAGRYLMGLTSPNPRFIVLATDGLPNCGGPEQDEADDAATIMAVANITAAGIPVFVIGVGTLGDGDATLSAMAQAGGKPRAATPAYYPVTTSADLSAALSVIGGQIVSCTLPIRQPPDPSNIAVDADGNRVPHSATDGWEYGAGMTTIQLHGSWCTSYQNGTIKDVQTVFGCPGVVIP